MQDHPHKLEKTQFAKLKRRNIRCFRCGQDFQLGDSVVSRKRCTVGPPKYYHEVCWLSGFIDSTVPDAEVDEELRLMPEPTHVKAYIQEGSQCGN